MSSNSSAKMLKMKKQKKNRELQSVFKGKKKKPLVSSAVCQ